MRALAIDLGDKRTGLALGDSHTGIAAPLGLIEIPITDAGGNALLTALAKAVDEHTDPADTILVGLPLNMDGTEGPRAKLTRAFAARLSERIGREIVLIDERKTSQMADARLAQTGLTHKQKKKRRDAIAAAAICQAFLEDPPSARADPYSSEEKPKPT